MIESAMIALIRDGQTTLYRDPCGSVLFPRNLVWGQRAVEQWLDGQSPTEQFDSDCGAGAVIDYDARAMLWYTECDPAQYPRAAQLVDALIAASWSGFEIIYGDGISDLQIAAGGSLAGVDDRSQRLREIDGDRLAGRSETLRDECEPFDEFDPQDADQRYAWITILDENNSLQHRLLREVPLDVIRNEGSPLDRLAALPGYEVPAERNVTEAIMFDLPAKQIRLWGGRNARDVAKEMASHWGDWTLTTIESDGYGEHCRFSGPAGQPLSDAEALGNMLPGLLLTRRIDPGLMLGEIGKSVKGCLAKAVTGLTVLICLPFFVFALVSGNWKTGAIAIGVVAALAFVTFKSVERRWRRGFRERLSGAACNTGLQAGASPAVAGPIDAKQRRSEMDELLRRLGLPSIRECEPYFEHKYARFERA